MRLPPEQLARALASAPWAIVPERLADVRALLSMDATLLAERANAPELKAARGNTPAMRGAVAVVPVRGFLFHRPNFLTDYGMGCAATDLMAVIDQLAAHPDIRAIVLDVDSPGGEVNGIPELTARIEAAGAEKRLVAVANSYMASAAYWLSAPAAEIVASPSAMVGSIGVYWEHWDVSAALETAGIKPTIISAGKYKTEGADSKPLTEEAQAHMQEIADAVYGDFVKAVAKGREVSTAAVRSGYGEGRVLTAKLALEADLVDRVATLDEVVAKLAGGKATPAPAGRRADTLRRKLALDKLRPLT